MSNATAEPVDLFAGRRVRVGVLAVGLVALGPLVTAVSHVLIGVLVSVSGIILGAALVAGLRARGDRDV